MAYVKTFEHDVFISYTRADDNSDLGGSWVTVLRQSIQDGLEMRGLRGCSVFMDHELPGHLDLETELPRRLSDSACLVVVLSPAYLRSEWCGIERRAFLDFLQKKRDAGEPVFVVEKDDVPLEERPEELKGRRGYRFWERAPNARASRPVRRSQGADNATYFDATMGLCIDIGSHLQSLAEGTTPQAGVAPIEHTVYLAEVTDDIHHKAEEVRAFLEQSRVRVLPTDMILGDSAAMKRDLGEAEAFVQLLSSVPSRHGIARRQFDLAVEMEVPVLQWRPPEVDPDSLSVRPDYLELLTGSTVRAEGLEAFKNNVVDFLNRPQSTERRERDGSEFMIFVNVNPDDWELGRSVSDLLLAQGASLTHPIKGGSPKEAREDLENNLLFADAVIIVYGLANRMWVKNQILQQRKIVAKRDETLLAFAVFRGPDQDHVDLGVEMPGLDVVQVHPHELEATVAAFIRKMREKIT